MGFLNNLFLIIIFWRILPAVTIICIALFLILFLGWGVLVIALMPLLVVVVVLFREKLKLHNDRIKNK